MEKITIKDFINCSLNFEGNYFAIPEFYLKTKGIAIKLKIHNIWKNKYHIENEACPWDFEFKPKNSTYWCEPSYRHDSMDGLIFGKTPKAVLKEIMDYIKIELTGEEVGTIDKSFN